MNQLKIPAALILVLAITACAENEPDQVTVPGRWYTVAQVESGALLYQSHCAVCHAADGSATAEWRTPDALGNYPPPPLNGTAHTWHHPLAALDDTIANGGVRFGGVMPGFASGLSREERLAIIAWFQSLWPDEIYARWMEIERRSHD
jgi:mono/diheme cytochrome c family protein